MRHIVWDWNGTLFDDLHVVVEAVNVALDDPRAPHVTADLYRTHYTRPVRVFYERLLGRGIGDEEWVRIDARFHTAYEQALAHADLAPDAIAALDAAAGSGRGQSLLSMWRHRALVDLVEGFGIQRYFARVDGLRGPGGVRKAASLAAHLHALGLRGRDVLVVGDAVDDAHAAAHVGSACVLYDGGSHPRDELTAAGAPVVDRLVDAVEVAVGLTRSGI